MELGVNFRYSVLEASNTMRNKISRVKGSAKHGVALHDLELVIALICKVTFYFPFYVYFIFA